MKNSNSAIFVNYEIYCDFCKMLNENSLGMDDKFVLHEEELMKKYGYSKDGCWYQKIK